MGVHSRASPSFCQALQRRLQTDLGLASQLRRLGRPYDEPWGRYACPEDSQPHGARSAGLSDIGARIMRLYHLLSPERKQGSRRRL